MTTQTLSPWGQMVATLESMARHRRQHPTTPSEEMNFSLLAEYYGRVERAREEGKKVVAHTVMLPTPLLYALDLVPLHLELMALTALPTLKLYEETFSSAKNIGLAAEICSAHRAQVGLLAQHIIPPLDAVAWSHQICDGSSKTGEFFQKREGMPSFFIERLYKYSPKEAAYYAQELRDLAGFLEELAGRRLDNDRLYEAMELTRQVVEIEREIYELKKAVPYPTSNRRSQHLMNMRWLYLGTKECLQYHRLVRDEIKSLVERGQGFLRQERYRLISGFPPPSHNLKLQDWMEREHGAAVVIEPYYSHWGDFDWDSSRPFETLAQMGFAEPMSHYFNGPGDEGMVRTMVGDAKAFHVQGAIFWSHIGCKQGSAMIYWVKEALREQVGIPTLVVDMDILDPSVTSDEAMKEKLEGFFELLDEKG